MGSLKKCELCRNNNFLKETGPVDCVSAGVGVTVSPFLGCLEIAESGQRGVGQGAGGGWWAEEVLWKDSAALANTHIASASLRTT